MPNIPWRKTGDKLEWYSQMRGASKITYETVGVVQMTFLRLLSQNAYQNITFTCVNSAMWYNQRTFKYDQAIKLLGDNEQEFSAQGVRPNVIIDGCKNRKGKSQTVFEIRSEKLGQLPIIDFFPVDYGLPHQAFGFEVGRPASNENSSAESLKYTAYINLLSGSFFTPFFSFHLTLKYKYGISPFSFSHYQCFHGIMCDIALLFY